MELLKYIQCNYGLSDVNIDSIITVNNKMVNGHNIKYNHLLYVIALFELGNTDDINFIKYDNGFQCSKTISFNDKIEIKLIF